MMYCLKLRYNDLVLSSVKSPIIPEVGDDVTLGGEQFIVLRRVFENLVSRTVVVPDEDVLVCLHVEPRRKEIYSEDDDWWLIKYDDNLEDDTLDDCDYLVQGAYEARRLFDGIGKDQPARLFKQVLRKK